MEPDKDWRRTRPIMRVALIVGAGLSFLSGVQLFVLTSRTDTLFAWTIDARLSAVTIGAFYWSATAIALASWRRQPWVRARVAVPAVAAFLWATLFATLAHLDKFHLSAGGTLARGAAWIWLFVYIFDPIFLTTALVVQWRTPGEDPPRRLTLHPVLRVVLLAFAVLSCVLAAAMIFVPSVAVDAWVWRLTPLTSRAIGAWMLALAIAFASMWWENDGDRVRPAAIGMVVLSACLTIGFGRFFSGFSSAGPGFAGLAIAVALGATGAWCLWAGPRDEE